MNEPQIAIDKPAPSITTEEYNQLVNAVPVNKIVEDMRPKLEEHILTNMSNERAMREPLPDVTVHAFNKDKIIVKTSAGEVEIRKQKALDISIFKYTNSPFYQLFMGDVKIGTSELQQLFTEEEILFEIIYQFTHDVKSVYNLIKKDLKAYKELVIEEVGEKYSMADIPVLIDAIINHIGLVSKARVDMESSNSSDDKKKV